MPDSKPSSFSSAITRRDALKLVTAGTLVGLGATPQAGLVAAMKSPAARGRENWNQMHDRVWLGGEYWANPMEDWRISNGAAECQSRGPNRNIHSLTHQITRPTQGFEMQVDLTTIESLKKDGGAGFRFGVRSELNEYRSNCFVNRGVIAGIVGGELKLADQTAPFVDGADPHSVTLNLSGRANGSGVTLKLSAKAQGSGDLLGTVETLVDPDDLLGNVSVVSNYGGAGRDGGGKIPTGVGSRHRFSNWKMSGEAFQVSPEQRFGPLLWSMYTLSDSRTDEGFVMKMSALTGPMGAQDSHEVELHIQRDGQWQSLGNAKLDPDAWVATFRIPNWDESADTPYKLVYRERQRDGSINLDEWTGTVRANPVGRPLRMAALTCQNDYAFPYEPVANNIERMDPDLALFNGDQIYEAHGGFGIIRDEAVPAILNYLRKYYQFGWAFRYAMRNQPTLCLPDDHDVFQGNIWGEGGKPMDIRDGGASSRGGYIQPARMVHAVHRTTVSHHPDPFDPTPSLQDISVYYGDMVYGDVSFAILADRQWKSGPERVETGSGRADHVSDPNFNTAALDKPGLVLLGERQEKFIKHWVQDWRGHTLKAVISQTVFAAVATHHGGRDGYLKADLESGSWPQTARNRAVDLLRPAMALHINGDQHLTTLAQYGTDEQRTGSWSFCTPAIAAGYPRWWLPDEVGIPHQNRPKHGRANTGEFIDGFGNKVYVYAVGNPLVGQAPNRYDKAHEKGSGFGFVTFDTTTKTYLIESFRFLIDPLDGNPNNQFPGWPVTIHQKENRGENLLD